MSHQPSSVDEWREAAILAAACSRIEAARLYGFVQGGPAVNVARCEQILEQAKVVGIEPTEEEIDEAMVGLVAAMASGGSS
jgi:hypothetical protein